MGKSVNKVELAEIHGVSERALTDWQTEGMPILAKGERGESNEYDTATTIQWRIERELKKVRDLSPRDEGIMLDNELKRRALAEKDRTLVPLAEVEPVWTGRVLAAAAFLSNQHSRLSAILEATPGIDGKRGVLKRVFAEFLNTLGVDGERMQNELEKLFATLPAEELDAFMRKIQGRDAPSTEEQG